MVAHYLLEPDQPHGMDALAQAFLITNAFQSRTCSEKGKNQKSMADIPPAEVVNYACEDADITLQLADVLIPKLKEEGLTALFRDVEMPLLSVLMDMELEGAAPTPRIWPSSVTRLPKNWMPCCNPFKGTPVCRSTWTRPSSWGMCCLSISRSRQGQKDQDRSIPHRRSRPQQTQGQASHRGRGVEYRKLKKLRSTYVEPLPTPSSGDGTRHTTYMQVVAATGRLSSKDPTRKTSPSEPHKVEKSARPVPRSANHVLVAAITAKWSCASPQP